MRREMKEKALEICQPQVSAFAECAREKGLMVIFSCRKLHKAVQSCLAEHNSEAAWEQYKDTHKDELERRSKMRPPPS